MNDIGMNPDYRSGGFEDVRCAICDRIVPEVLSEVCGECGAIVCLDCCVRDLFGGVVCRTCYEKKVTQAVCGDEVAS